MALFILHHYMDSTEFVEFMKEENNDKFIDFDDKKKVSDEELKRILRVKYKIVNISDMENENNRPIIKEVYSENRVSLRQMERVIGINRGLIERLLKT